MKKTMYSLLVVLSLAAWALPALAGKPAFGKLYYNDEIVRTVVPPAAMPKKGRDNFYVVESGAAGQMGIAAVAPGDRNYHGGKWAFHSVEWSVAPYLLTSEAAVLSAKDAGDVTVTRVPANDFKCPIQP